jgi:hypothetical protein
MMTFLSHKYADSEPLIIDIQFRSEDHPRMSGLSFDIILSGKSFEEAVKLTTEV